MKNTTIILQAFLMPDFDAMADKWEISISPDVISNIAIFHSTNKLNINAILSFTDIDSTRFMPFIMYKYPPLVRILIEEFEIIEETNEFKLINTIFNQVFMIDNTQIENTTSAGSNRAYDITLKLQSIHNVGIYGHITPYSNHNTDWAALDLKNDIDGIFNTYLNANGLTVKYANSEDVFGVNLNLLKRRFATVLGEDTANSLLNLIRSVYEPAKPEYLLSEKYTLEDGNIIANALVGFSMDIEDNRPTFFRLSPEDDYSVEVKESIRRPKLIPLRFEESGVNNPITIALPPNSSYSSLLKNFGINYVHVFYNTQTNLVLTHTTPNVFKNRTTGFLLEDVDVVAPVKDYILYENPVNNLARIKKFPKLPISDGLYDAKYLNNYLRNTVYSGVNLGVNYYDLLINEALVNNVIYLNVSNMIGHKVGQTIYLVVQELTNNMPELNYHLNLAFAGAWKIVSVKWDLTISEFGVRISEVLGLTRMSKLIGDKGMFKNG